MPLPASHRTRRAVVLAVALLSAVCGALPVAQAHAQAQQPRSAASAEGVRQDFNGDGYEDLATGSPLAVVGGRKAAGYVAVVYGSAHGLDLASKKVLTQASPGIPGTPEVDDRFGAHLITGDLDGDGYTDLVVPATGEDWTWGGEARTNSQTVLWGSAVGLSGGTILQPGRAFATHYSIPGDFDGDGHLDLALPGGVRFGPFTREGLPARTQGISVSEHDDSLLEMAAGDVDGDGLTDLVSLTMPADWEPGDQSSGHNLNYLHATRDGFEPLTVLRNGRGDKIEGGEDIELGDVNGDGRDDLVFGRPRPANGNEEPSDPSQYGSRVGVVLGTAQGLPSGDPRMIDQDTPGVPGVGEAGDLFGASVKVGDVNGDGYADIVAGNPYEDFAGVQDAGTVAVIPGGASGPTGAGSKVFSQNTAGVPGAAERRDYFSEAVTLLDGDGDGRADLVVGAPGENTNAGSVWAFRSTASGVTTTGSLAFGAKALGTTPDSARLGAEFPR
ncbi:FG-GAP and VCBS repeat-containing protein [Streptomyces sp. DT2A-34]|uniref:FG-GAP and VCBS repeat-containing protein n=1 Tax=Streptomyces sp. DT2A-34 TaxID=3051182 RepID=UPI00265BC08D|nr:FG-GAP and VCBS repeat-containing protein [Streptomyces sp. DT2A-34]MDO0914995.1 FG-GAP and VCBS repeat-containing protein [Streptomyces sp. DT2A-34]